MTREPHTLSYRNPGFGPDDVDGLLRNFFRAEMPDPWPTLKAPVEMKSTKPTAPRRWAPVRSRMALAASVALLLLGTWCFSVRTPDYSVAPSEGRDGAGSASPLNLKNMRDGGKVGAPSSNQRSDKGGTGCDCCAK